MRVKLHWVYNYCTMYVHCMPVLVPPFLSILCFSLSLSLSPSSPPPPSLSVLVEGSDTHSHSESTESPPPSTFPPRHHTLSTLTGSDSRCSSSSTAESALLSTGEKGAQGGAELKLVSEKALIFILLLLTCGCSFADSKHWQWSCQPSDQHAA